MPETKEYAHRGQHVDGVFFHVGPSLEQAKAKILEYVACRSADDIRVNVTYFDDWGGTHRVVEVPAGFTSENLEKLEEAYDAREMGIATDEQLKFLENL